MGYIIGVILGYRKGKWKLLYYDRVYIGVIIEIMENKMETTI